MPITTSISWSSSTPISAPLRWLALTVAAGYGDVERSALIDLGPDVLADRS